LYVEGFQATAPLVSTQCGSTTDTSNMNVSVSPGIAHAIISNDVKTVLNSTSTADYQAYMGNPTHQQPATILTLSLASIPLLKGLLPPSLANISLSIGSAPNGSGAPTQGFSLAVQPPGSQSMTFKGAGSLNAFQPTSGQANSNQLGAQASDLVGQLITALLPPSAALYATLGTQTFPLSTLSLGNLLQSTLSAALGAVGSILGGTLGVILDSVLTPLTSVLTGITSLLLQPLLTSLDTLIVPLLQLLGVQIGIATVHAISLQCGEAQLVQ
jgi:hypothetical protein